MADLASLVAKQPPAVRYEIYELVESAARKTAMLMGTVGLAFSGGGIRSATFNLGFLQGASALGLLKQFDYLSTVSGGGYIGGWFAAWALREGRGPGSEPNDHVQRTSKALENVQKQLNPSRARQASAVRRWAWPPDNRPLPPQPTLEDEPEPVHHLREHSNYLAPRIGLLSIDTWTMVSVYLRNLFLNQFIVLPMLLVVVTLPRLSLLLFSDSTWGPMVALLRGCRGWLVAVAPAALFLACITAPQLIGFLARRVVRGLRRWNAEVATLLLVALGTATVAVVCMNDVLPRLDFPRQPGEFSGPRPLAPA